MFQFNVKKLLTFVGISLALVGLGSCSDEEFDAYPPKIPPMPQSGSRLKRLFTEWVAEDGTTEVEWQGGFYDEELKIKCSFQLAEDGKNRCLPMNNENAAFLAWPGLYMDANCKKQFVLITPSAPVCMEMKVKYALVTIGASCSQGTNPQLAVYQVSTTPKTMTSLYQKIDSGCQEADPNLVNSIAAGKQALEILSKMPISQFVAGQTGTYRYSR